MGLRPVQTEPPAPLLTQTKSIIGHTGLHGARDVTRLMQRLFTRQRADVRRISSSIDFIYMWGPVSRRPLSS